MAHSSSDIHDDDLDSLPSISSSLLSSETGDSADAQHEWEESLEQVQLLLTMVLMPFAGKYLGRKFAYWSRSFSSLLFTNTHPLSPPPGLGGSKERNDPWVLTKICESSGWARYMEWMYDVEIRWTNSKGFKAAGVAEAAATL